MQIRIDPRHRRTCMRSVEVSPCIVMNYIAIAEEQRPFTNRELLRIQSFVLISRVASAARPTQNRMSELWTRT